MKRLILTALVTFTCSTLLPAADSTFVRGDVNADNVTDISDPIQVIAYLFAGGEVACLDAADINDDGSVDIVDAINSLSALFSGTFTIPEPLSCGLDPTYDGLGCASYATCSPPTVPVCSSFYVLDVMNSGGLTDMTVTLDVANDGGLTSSHYVLDVDNDGSP